MNKSELVSAIAERTGQTKKDSEIVITAVFDTISDAMASGEKIQLVGFGSFEVKNRKPRIGRNPKTKERIDIAASRAPVFKPGKALKDAVNK